jgi:hypothetical protein
MNIIMICVYGALAILLLVQIYHAVVYCRGSARSDPDGRERGQYPGHILKRSEKAMRAVESGRIRKHLYGNSGLLCGGRDTAHRYADFADHSTVFRKIVDMRNSGYNGQD